MKICFEIECNRLFYMGINQMFHEKCIIYFASILVCLLSATSIAGQERTGSSRSTTVKRNTGPYCGVYCLYVLMKGAGKEIKLNELFRGEYIGSRTGSSLNELKKAAEEYRMHAEIVGNLTTQELYASSYPIILHVKATLESKIYDHYELFLGTKEGNARLYDPHKLDRLVPFYELAPRWDGTGLIISTTPIVLWTIFGSAWKRIIIYIVIAIVLILIARRIRRRWLPLIVAMPRGRFFWLTMVQCMGLTFFALAQGMIYHFANEEGLLANANATASIIQVHQGNFIPKINKKKVERLRTGDTVFIDARLARDFKAGHLEGAISVPVNATDAQRQKAMVGITKDARIVSYCQSAGCKYAEKVSIQLVADGFSNVSIFKGGWNEWKAKDDE